jgi:RND superfamily putative drug exporter
MSGFLYNLGRRCARHPWRVLGAWLLIAAVIVGMKGSLGGHTNDHFTVPGVESQHALDILKTQFHSQSTARGQVVVHTNDGTLATPAHRTALAETLHRVSAAPHVAGVSRPTVSRDGRTAFVWVVYDVDKLHADALTDIQTAARPARAAGIDVEASSAISEAGRQPKGKEVVGLVVAIIVLLAAFGSIIAMGIPIGSALFGLVVGLSGIGVLSGFTDVPSISPMLATMIGLGVGIDYALFVVTRHRQHLHEGMDPVDAAGRANATAGQAVLFAGGTVGIAICGLQLAGLPAVAAMGYASAIVVAISVAVALTLLPALLGFAGTNIDKLRVPHRAHDGDHRSTLSARWAHHVGGHPVRYAVVSLVALLALAAPMLSLRLAMADDGSAGKSTTERKAYDLVSESFGRGFNGPLQLVAELPHGHTAADFAGVAAAVAHDPGIAAVQPPMTSPNGSTVVVFATPKTGPQDHATEQLVRRLRTHVIPAAERGTGLHVLVGGQTAAMIDVSQRITDRLPLFIGAVVLLSFLLLMVVFRSVLVPLKAAIMNLLSITAAYGVIVAVFQWGWGASLIGLHEKLPVNPFVPMIMFAILFGLSMDYEVFLLSRVREEFLRTGDSHTSVVDGLGSTARVITSAALIMISVFGAFVGGSDAIVKMFGLGLATAVLIDATVVRMVLVPATMSLLGKANWWLPSWLDRVLPHLDLEGSAAPAESPVPEPELAPEPVAA